MLICLINFYWNIFNIKIEILEKRNLFCIYENINMILILYTIIIFRKIKQEIESLIMLYTTSIQTRCENDDSGNLVKKRCFENNDNSNLLSDVLNKVEDLVKQLSISNDDKNE